MPKPTQAELEQLHQSRLAAFVLRARRVKAHSLYQDFEKLERVGSVQFDLDVTSDGVWMTQSLPPEEVVESAAARVRPLLLQTEDAHHQKVLKALKWMLRDVERDDVRKFFDSLKEEWAEFDPQGRNTLAYAVQHGHVDEQEPTPALADNVLAFAWIYGDVVHGDNERLAETEDHGVAERFRAAAPLVCRLIVQTVATLHFIEWLRDQGLIAMPEEIFERPVVVDDPVFRQKVTVYMAPAGDEMPAMPLRVGDELGPEWRRLTALPSADPSTDDDSEAEAAGA
ncbi:hypothetical protein SIM91_02090 [Rhodococcus opacus]|uniref:hypothetical protein n=1 Tax=Rhodococcus TaxID=1827 RepID=UPI0024B7BABC|nr:MULTISPECIES: hypothetical protein [Rhodococcus]MDI9941391.1 hypothetical protein [Rhodococcus sp. IEGM 1351]MDX5962134.1 hypothetical protein [Rhodococcus opacus]